jgi:hypothetical protein
MVNNFQPDEDHKLNKEEKELLQKMLQENERRKTVRWSDRPIKNDDHFSGLVEKKKPDSPSGND